jgi:hypothetical protein
MTRGFIFGPCTHLNGLTVKVPMDIGTKIELLELLGDRLRFPDYYGVNWDAFEECLRDLSWLPERDIVICHLDLPLAGDEASLQTYLHILSDAIAKWTDASPHRLTVIFPAALTSKIEALIDG